MSSEIWYNFINSHFLMIYNNVDLYLILFIIFILIGITFWVFTIKAISLKEYKKQDKFNTFDYDKII